MLSNASNSPITGIPFGLTAWSDPSMPDGVHIHRCRLVYTSIDAGWCTWPFIVVVVVVFSNASRIPVNYFRLFDCNRSKTSTVQRRKKMSQPKQGKK